MRGEVSGGGRERGGEKGRERGGVRAEEVRTAM